MFGYVTINKPELKIKDYERYHAYYCGLCKTLKEKYGRIGQMTLTYDMTFLIILLTSLYEQKPNHQTSRCVVHPIKKQSMLTNEITEYASDMNIALSYHHLVDDWEDEKSVKGFMGAQLIKRKYKEIEKKYPRQVKVIEESLNALKKCEERKERNLDEVSRCFGELMAEFFVYRQDEWEEDLREVGFYLGKFIYLIDAYEDLEKDIKNGSYNPLIELSKTEEYEETCGQILMMMMSECTKAFERLPLVVEVELLRNILYAGVWSKYKRLRNEKMKREDGKEQEYGSI